MIRDFSITQANSDYNTHSGQITTEIEASIYHDGLDGNFKGLDSEIMKFLMQKHYKNISFEELDLAIKEKYVEYFV